MGRTTRTELLALPSEECRWFLKQIATSGAVAGAAALPAWAQEESVLPEEPRAPAGQPTVAETLARYATSLKYDDCRRR